VGHNFMTLRRMGSSRYISTSLASGARLKPRQSPGAFHDAAGSDSSDYEVAKD
jgi:hypothetical protein